MLEYISGKIIEKSPTYVVLENNGLGYFIHISLQSYIALEKSNEDKLYVHNIIREDAHLLYGFYDKAERELFRMLIMISGVGANTARLLLSSISTANLQQAIKDKNVAMLKSVKGIGSKTAERIIIELNDKLNKTNSELNMIKNETILTPPTLKNEALSALVMLGFNNMVANKALEKVYSNTQPENVEQLIKAALKHL